MAPLTILRTAAWLAVTATLARPLRAELPIRGCDVSSLAKSEALGGRYFDRDGRPGDALEILHARGVNLVRVRVWVASPDGYHGTAQLLGLARRAHALGLKLLVDFHYSDTWADPAHQKKPAAWKRLPPAALAEAVGRHTEEVCAALAAQGTPADFVQIGNEINDGMLWPTGRITTNRNRFAPLAALLRAGIAGARRAHPDTRIILHLAEGGDWAKLQWWFDGVRAEQVDWDITGVSYYPYWHGTFAQLGHALANAAGRYGKPVLVVETAYPWTLDNGDHLENVVAQPRQLTAGFPASRDGQAAMLRALAAVVAAVPGGRGTGFIYWDATWTPVRGNGWEPGKKRSGNGWENQALFDFAGRELPALAAFAPSPGEP